MADKLSIHLLSSTSSTSNTYVPVNITCLQWLQFPSAAIPAGYCLGYIHEHLVNDPDAGTLKHSSKVICYFVLDSSWKTLLMMMSTL
jgi:hypothetical protein